MTTDNLDAILYKPGQTPGQQFLETVQTCVELAGLAGEVAEDIYGALEASYLRVEALVQREAHLDLLRALERVAEPQSAGEPGISRRTLRDVIEKAQQQSART